MHHSYRGLRVCYLLVSNMCNLNCIYCYEKFKNRKKMTFEVAKRVLTKELALVGTDGWPDDLLIEFLGGEPFTNFPVIQDTCEWIWNTYPDKTMRLMCRTNGTCLTPDAKEWLVNNKDKISVGLSLDGLPEIQELNRHGSIKRIPVDFFIENWPTEEIKSVISPQGVHLMAASAIDFYERNWNFNMTLAAGIDWPDSAVEELEKQLNKIIDYLMEHPHLTPVKGLFKDEFISVCLPIDSDRERMCGSYNEIAAYSPEGTRLRCHIFAEITLGKELADHYSEDKNFPEKLTLDPACQGCPAHAFCSVCPGFNLIAGNEMNIQDKRVCKSMYALLRANCRLFILKNQERALSGDLTREEWACMKFAMQHVSQTDSNTP